MCVVKTAWERCVEFHGHTCPGLAIGYRAAEAAIQKMGISFSEDEEIVCVTENNACGVDAVQLLTGCSMGKGNLVYRGTGKQAFSFFNRKNGAKLRIVMKRSLSQEGMDRAARQKYILEAPLEELFDFKEPVYEAPEPARLFSSIQCESCSEFAAEPKMRLQDGKKLCLDCISAYTRGWDR
ncbi:MAG: FmdE family protein [Dissulfurispiraceae bacterium]|jgi:formylmethanofuran dehydrogenase subunit E|nr:FmdE family protein [Dissulfurispiraceae bacterium]